MKLSVKTTAGRLAAESRVGGVGPGTVVCRGTPRERGVAQGVALRSQVEALRSDLARIEAFRLSQPFWMPYPLYRWTAERRSAVYLRRALSVCAPALRERMKGIALGAGVSLGTVSLFNAMEPFLSAVGGWVSCGHGCSAVALRASRSASGEPLIARNFDYLELAQPYHFVREERPASGLRSLQFTVAPLAGAMDGINEAGLCIVYDYAFVLDQAPSPAPSVSMLVCDALENCRSTEEAVRHIMTRPRWGAGLLMLADEVGDLASLELSNTRAFLRRPGPGEDCLFHTNRFRGAGTTAVEIPAEAVYDQRAPRALRGIRLRESAERRDARWQELLADGRPLSLHDLENLQADHGADGQPSAFTPCVHSDYYNTTTAVQLLPRSRRMRIAFQRPCQASYTEFDLL